MLVLTRRVGEEIIIGDNIRVSVLLLKGKTVRLGVTAPSSVPIVRQELLAACSEGAQPPGSDRPGKSRATECTSTEPAS
jgi:carbon storage regulator CsrA